MFCVFAKDPTRGKQRLVPAVGVEGAAALARAFLADTLALVPAQRHLWADGEVPGEIHARQEGRDLGARILHALRSELSAGARSVVVVGTDAPTLPRRLLEEAVERLDGGACDLVLGPAADGGYYLVGATGAGVLPSLFLDIPWSSERVLRVTLTRAYAAGLRVHLLPWWYDVDTPEDLRLLRADLERLDPSIAPATRACLAALTC